MSFARRVEAILTSLFRLQVRMSTLNEPRLPRTSRRRTTTKRSSHYRHSDQIDMTLQLVPPLSVGDEWNQVVGVCQRTLWFAVALFTSLFLTRTAHAADSSEFWPEVQGFLTLGDQTRLFLDVPYTAAEGADTLELVAYLDISLKPVRKELRSEDWQRGRYFWARIGYDRILKVTRDDGAQVSENRGVVSFYSKTFLPAKVVAETRIRADLRWIGDDYSTRYRGRIEFTREFTILRHTVVPFLNYEWFYDTRYDNWARTLAMFGPEITVSPHFRYEVYVARQVDRLPERTDTSVFGLNFKWYY